MLSSASLHLHFRRNSLPSLFLVIAALLALAPARQSQAQSFDATALRQPTDMGMNWLVKADDDPAYAQTNFDDSHWMVVDPNKSLKTYLPNPPQRRVVPAACEGGAQPDGASA